MSSNPTFEQLAPLQQAAVSDIVRVYQAAFLGRPADRSLTVISGPGGAGKSTIVAVAIQKIREWLELRQAALLENRRSNQPDFGASLRSAEAFEASIAGARGGQSTAVKAIALQAVKSARQVSREQAEVRKDDEMAAVATLLERTFSADQKEGQAYDF